MVRNVTFHGVGEPPRSLEAGEAHVWLGREQFLATLDRLRGREDVRISFDDSNRSDVDVALPALRERGLRATFFVLAGRIGDPHHLGEDDLRTLLAEGMTIGSHGMRHRDWRRLGDDDLAEELVEARRVLQDVGAGGVTAVSVPFGSYDRRVLGRLHEAGYARVFTSDGGPARSGAWLQPRTSVTVDDDPATVAPDGRDAAPVAVERQLKRLVKRWR